MNTKIIFINGAPRAGKSTVAEILVSGYHDCHRLGFADHLKLATHAAYGMYDAPVEYFEDCKDEPHEAFFGLTPRLAYIQHSEQYMKPLHGVDIFGKLWLRRARQLENAQMIAVSDSGFAPEADPAIAHYGADNCLLLRILRDGHDFSNDSRSHIVLPGVEIKIIFNNDTYGELRRNVCGVVEDFLSRAP